MQPCFCLKLAIIIHILSPTRRLLNYQYNVYLNQTLPTHAGGNHSIRMINTVYMTYPQQAAMEANYVGGTLTVNHTPVPAPGRVRKCLFLKCLYVNNIHQSNHENES